MFRRESSIRASVLVPHLGDDDAFEQSLVSVLENRPADIEICVVHDGSYEDPFDLGDEVRFVAHDSNALPELITAGAAAARGRIVHVLGAGVRATDGWLDAALEKFELDDAAVVAPVARQCVDGPITAAGWRSTGSRLSTAIAAGKTSPGRRDAASIRGVCLTASFWRRDVLQSLTRALATHDATAAQFGWSRMVCAKGWRCILAEDSIVLADEAMLGLMPSMRAGSCMRSIEAELRGGSFASSAISVTMAAAFNLLRPTVWGEMTGEAVSLLTGHASARDLRLDEVLSPADEAESIRIGDYQTAALTRRAA